MDRPDRQRPVVVVVTWEGAHLLEPCLHALSEQDLPHDVLVVDNASTDGTRELLDTRFPHVRRLELTHNQGFAGGVAAALDVVDAPYVALINNDAVAQPSWLRALVDHLDAHPEAAAVTSLMLLAGTDPPRVNNTGVVLLPTWYGADRGLDDDPDQWREPGPVFGFSGGAALLRAEAVRDVGGFPAPYFLYYEDTDVSWRLRRAGWAVRYEPGAVVFHEHAATSDRTSRSFAFHNERNRLLMVTRCSTPAVAGEVWARFALTTGSLAVKRLLARPVPDAHQFRVLTRLQILYAALRMLPWALRTRSRTRLAQLPAREATGPGTNLLQ